MVCRSFLLKLKFLTVEPVLFIYLMLVFMENLALQELFFIKSCIHIDNPVNISDCTHDSNHSSSKQLATTWSEYNNICFYLLTILASFYVGSWSDHFGRKYPMLIPPIGTTIASIINVVLAFYLRTHMAFLFISTFISGITFGTVGIISTTFGFVSDFSHEESRTRRIIILEAMIYIGGTIGVYIAGAFIKHANYDSNINSFVWLFIFEAVMSCLTTIYILIRIPNQYSDSQSLQGTSSCFSIFSLRHVTESFRTVFRTREEKKHIKIYLLLTALFFMYFANVIQIILGFYFVSHQLNWDVYKYATFTAIKFGVEGTALLIGLPLLYYFVAIPDHFVGMLGLVSKGAGCMIYGLSSNDYMVYSCIALFVFSEFTPPTIRSMLSKLVNAEEKGKIFAFTTLLQNVCFFLGSFTLMTIFSQVSFRGLSFEIVAVLQVMSLIIFIYLYLTRDQLVTVYDYIEHADGSASEICSVLSAADSINTISPQIEEK